MDLLTYVINLPRRVDRRNFMEDQLQKRRLEAVFVDGVDGSDPDLQIPQWWRGSRGAYGAYAAHRSIAEAQADSRRDYVVLEDDVLLDEGIVTRLENHVNAPRYWDLFLLGGEHLRPPTQEMGMIRCRGVRRLWGYVMSGGYTRTFIEDIDAATAALDEHLISVQLKRDYFMPKEPMVRPADFDSDVQVAR